MRVAVNQMPATVGALCALALAAGWMTKEPGARAEEPTRYVPTVEASREGYRWLERANRPRPQVYKGQITPHWFADNNRFWYRNDLKGGTKEFIMVDAERGVRQAAFDHAKLAAALSKAAEKQFQADRLPFDGIELAQDGKAVRFKVAEINWQCDLASYECTRVSEGNSVGWVESSRPTVFTSLKRKQGNETVGLETRPTLHN